MFKRKNKLIPVVTLVLFCSSLYGYKVIIISDDKEKTITFWCGKDRSFSLKPGQALIIDGFNPKVDLLCYNRGGTNYLQASKKINNDEKIFGKLTELPVGGIFTDLKHSGENSYLVIRFASGSGFAVNIVSVGEGYGFSKGIVYRYVAKYEKGLLGKAITYDYIDEFTIIHADRILNLFTRELNEILEDTKELEKNYKDLKGRASISDLHRKIQLLNGFAEMGGSPKIFGGKINFYTSENIKKIAIDYLDSKMKLAPEGKE